MKNILMLLAAASLLAGCASDGSGHCGGVFDYQKADTLAAVKVPGVSPTATVSALEVPPETAKIVPYGRLVPSADHPHEMRMVCLDVPPPMAPIVEQQSTTPVPAPVPAPAPAAVPHS
ncbi:MAG: hypothetical protein ACRESS_01705 [Stenotrophobium sp.]